MPIGAIVIRRTEVAAVHRQADRAAQTFADQAVIAIENVRLFKELQESNRELTEALEQQTATSEILRVISSSPTDVQPVFDAIAESAVRSAALIDVVSPVRRRQLHFGRSAQLLPTGTVIMRRQYPMRPTYASFAVRRCMANARIIHIDDAQNDPDYDRADCRCRRLAHESWLCRCCARAYRSVRSWSPGTRGATLHRQRRSRCWRPSPTRR